jgi:hypothetical protein
MFNFNHSKFSDVGRASLALNRLISRWGDQKQVYPANGNWTKWRKNVQ